MELCQASGKGPLVVIGGAEDKEGDRLILKEFVRLAKGPKARLVVMTVATDHPEEVGAEYRAAFKELGVDDVQVVDVSERADTESEAALKALEQATGLYFTGGDQLHITSLLGGTEMQRLIHRLHEKGIVIGGTSAGAAMMSNSMMLGGDGECSPRVGSVQIGPGTDLILGTVIDTHFAQRGRFGRLLAAVAHYPQELGLGIDENTAMIVNKTEFEVIGEGAVTVVDAGAMTYTSLPHAEDNQGLALYGITVHVLSAGSRFDLAARRPVLAARAPKRGKSSNSHKSGGPQKSSAPAKAGKPNKGPGK